MNCTYCGCTRSGTKKINNWDYCDIHFEQLSKVPIVNKVRGHISSYHGELKEHEFDSVDEIEWNKRRTYQKDEDRN